MQFVIGSNLTADRLWTLVTGDADRTFTMNANCAVNQDLETTDTVTFGEVLVNTSNSDADAKLVVRVDANFDGMTIKAPDGPRIFFDEGAEGSEVETAFIGLQAADDAFVMRQWTGSGTDILFSIQSGGARSSAADREVLQLLHDGDGSIFGNFTVGSDLTINGELTGNLTVNDDLTISGDLIADDIRWQDSYILTEAQAGGFPAIRNTVSGEPMNLRVQSADMDGTDTIGFNLDAVGQPGASNRETMVFSYNNARNDYEFFTFRTGTGLNRDIKIGHNSNPNELVILTTGEILVRNKIAFSQPDLNEFWDSITSGELDGEATISINLRIDGTEQMQIFNGSIRPTTTNDIDIGTSSLLMKDIWQVGKHQFFDSAIGIYSQADTFLDLFADGAVRIGDSSAEAPTNYTNFAPDGEITLVGTARVEQFIEGLALTGKGAAAPTERTTEVPYLSWTFAVGNDSSQSFEAPYQMDYTDTVAIKVHWYTSVDQTDDEVQWQAIWNAIPEGGGEVINAGSTTIVSGDINCPTQWHIIESSIGTISGSSIAQDDVIGLNLERIAIDDGTNPAINTIHILSIEFEFYMNKLGEPT